jgi:hypothetical protein
MTPLRAALSFLWLPFLVGPVVAQATPWTFVSIPDFQNNDIASIADPQSQFPNNVTLPAGFIALNPAWDSCTANYDDSVDWIVSRLAAEDPAFVTVAGDMVMGHWDRSSDGRNVFGPLNTDANARAAVNRAADYYYDIWFGRFDPARNTHLSAVLTAMGKPLVPMDVHGVVGDHELGDNNWGAGTLKSRLVVDYKLAFERWFTRTPAGPGNSSYRYVSRPVGTKYEGTAYAFQRQNLLTVVVDEFRQDNPASSFGSATGSVRATVDDGQPGTTNDDQLAWLDSVLAAGRANPTVDFIIVQGHMPVLRPVRARNSSNLGVVDVGGAAEYDTLLWQTMSRHKVDAYFCGEVHDVTLSRYGGVTQVVHGALIGNHSPINYLVVDVHPDRLELTCKEIQVNLATGSSLWQTGGNRPRSDFDITASSRAAGYATVGRATLTKVPGGGSVVTLANGKLAPYGTFENGQGDYLLDLSLDQLVNGTYPNAAGPVNAGVPAGSVRAVQGVRGQGISIGPGNDRVVAGGLAISGTRERTISLWARTTATGLVTVATFGSNVTGAKWDIDIDGASGGRLELGVGGGRTTGQGPSVNDGQWHMLSTVLPTGATNLSNVRLFVDGALAYTGSGNRALSTGGGDFILGHAANADWFQQFTGDIDEVVAWKRALSDGQVKSLFDVTSDPTLGYSAREFESLLQVYDQQNPEVVLGNLTWRRATGLSGPAGLRVIQAGVRYELVFDAATGEGLKVVVPSRKEYFGAGCPGSSGLTPDILVGGDPIVGGTLFAINLLDARSTTPAVLLLNFARADLAIGNGCTLYPASPAIGLQALTNFGGQAFLGFALPPNPSLLGAEMFGQWAVADLGGAAGPGLAALTRGLRLVFGDS